jgi:hypothetical protein
VIRCKATERSPHYLGIIGVLERPLMKTLLLLPGLLLVPLVTLGQEPALAAPRWTVSVMVSSAMTYRTLLDKEGTTQTDAIIALRDDAEEPRFGYGGQLMLARHLGERWTVGIGVSYARFGYQSDYDLSDLTFGDMIDPRRGFIYGTSSAPPSSIRYIDDYQYIGVPVQAQRSWGGKKLHPIVSVTVSPSYLLVASTISSVEFADGSSDRNSNSVRSDFQDFNLFVSVEAGCAYDVCERMQVRLLPYGSMSLLEIIDAPISARLWSVGLQAGVGYCF